MRRHAPSPSRAARARVARRTLAMLVLGGVAIASWGAAIGPAASTGVVVTMDVLSTTTLAAGGCATGTAGVSTFGTVQPGTGAVTDADCAVTFGSTNDTSTLRAFQPDGAGTAMSKPPTSATDAWSGETFWDVAMVDASNGWAVGSGSGTTRIVRTTDGGATWIATAGTSGLPGTGRGIDAVSASTAWAAQNDTSRVTRTTDSGANWTSSDVPGTNPRLNGIVAWDANIAWATGADRIAGQDYARIWYTSNGGTSWTAVYSYGSTNTRTYGGDAVSATDVWIPTGYGTILHATDAVTFASAGSTGDWNATRLDALDANRIAVATEDGYVRVTVNGGGAWNSRYAAERTYLADAAWSPDGDLWVVGHSGSVQRSADDGVTWTVIQQPHESTGLVAVSSEAAGQVVAVGNDRTAIASSNDGATWSHFSYDAGIGNWAGIDGVDGGRVWRVGAVGMIATSTDAGGSWTNQASPTTNALYEVAAIDRNRAVAVGAAGTIVRTTNAGTNWSIVASGTTNRLRDVTVTPDGWTMYAVGDAGTALRSRDAGATWSTLPTGVTEPIWSVSTWSASSVIIGTGNRNVHTSTDSGQTWTQHTMPATALEAIVAVQAVPGTDTAYVIENFDMHVTTNATSGAATWVQRPISTYGQFTDLDYSDGVLWSIGHYGMLRRSTDAGVSWSTISGVDYYGMLQAVVALGPDAATIATERYATLTTNKPQPIADYSGTQWGSSSAMFGICLRSAPGAANTWPTTGSCPQADGTNWRALPLHGGIAAAKVGDLLAPGTATASFRFGVFVPAGQQSGAYRAPVTFELVAPAA